MNEDIVQIGSVTLNKSELKEAVMADVDVSSKSSKYDWDRIIEEAINHGIDFEEQEIVVQCKDWCFVYHLVTLDQLRGVGL